MARKKHTTSKAPQAPDGRDYFAVELFCVWVAMTTDLEDVQPHKLLGQVYKAAFQIACDSGNKGLTWELHCTNWHHAIAAVLGHRYKLKSGPPNREKQLRLHEYRIAQLKHELKFEE